MLGDARGGRGDQLRGAMRLIAAEGRGVVVLIREPLADLLSDRGAQPLRRRVAAERRRPSCATTASARRSCSISACASMMLLSNHKTSTIVGLEGYGLTVDRASASRMAHWIAR